MWFFILMPLTISHNGITKRVTWIAHQKRSIGLYSNVHVTCNSPLIFTSDTVIGEHFWRIPSRGIWLIYFICDIAMLMYFLHVLCRPKTMMTSSNGNIFRGTGLCAGNSPVTSEFPSQKPVTRSFDVFFDLHLNKLLSKQSWGWWCETPPRSLWRHCNTETTWDLAWRRPSA